MKNRESKTFLQKQDQKDTAKRYGTIASWLTLLAIVLATIFVFTVHPTSFSFSTISPEAWEAFQAIGGTDALQPPKLLAGAIALIILLSFAFARRSSFSSIYSLLFLATIQARIIEKTIWALFPSGRMSPMVATLANDSVAFSQAISNVVLTARSYGISPAAFVSKVVTGGILIAFTIGCITTWMMRKFYDSQWAADI